MKKILIGLIVVTFMMTASVALANGKRNSCEGYKGKLLNRCHEVIHPDQKDAAGIGVDVLIHKIDQGDFVAEYKYDFNNESHSIFGVFKTNKSLVDIVKGLFNKDTGE